MARVEGEDYLPTGRDESEFNIWLARTEESQSHFLGTGSPAIYRIKKGTYKL